MRERQQRLYEVYLITNTVNGKLYVGKTVYSAHYRAQQHRRCGHGILDHAIKKYGWEKFSVRVLYQGTSEREINVVERAMIAQYNTLKPRGYNLTIGGEGTVGYKMSEEGKARVSAQFKGKKLTPEQCEMRRVVHLGRKRPPETGAKITAAKIGKPSKLKGRKQSPEWIAARMEGRRRVGNPMFTDTMRNAAIAVTSMPVRCRETGETWPSRKALVRHLGLRSKGAVSRCIERGLPFNGLTYENAS